VEKFQRFFFCFVFLCFFPPSPSSAMLRLPLLALLALACLAGAARGYNTTEFITMAGYPAEEHLVATDDGFLLGVQRIPHGRNESENAATARMAQRPVAFLLHGLCGDKGVFFCFCFFLFLLFCFLLFGRVVRENERSIDNKKKKK
jgi:hypothetical protein